MTLGWVRMWDSCTSRSLGPFAAGVETGHCAGCFQVVAELRVVDRQPPQMTEGSLQLISQPGVFPGEAWHCEPPAPRTGQCAGFQRWLEAWPHWPHWRTLAATSPKCRQKVALLGSRDPPPPEERGQVWQPTSRQHYLPLPPSSRRATVVHYSVDSDRSRITVDQSHESFGGVLPCTVTMITGRVRSVVIA